MLGDRVSFKIESMPGKEKNFMEYEKAAPLKEVTISEEFFMSGMKLKPGEKISFRELGVSVSEGRSLLSERGSLLSEGGSLVAERGSLVSERGSFVSERGSFLVSERGALLSSTGVVSLPKEFSFKSFKIM